MVTRADVARQHGVMTDALRRYERSLEVYGQHTVNGTNTQLRASYTNAIDAFACFLDEVRKHSELCLRLDGIDPSTRR